jgi:hypothetical protein
MILYCFELFAYDNIVGNVLLSFPSLMMPNQNGEEMEIVESKTFEA